MSYNTSSITLLIELEIAHNVLVSRPFANQKKVHTSRMAYALFLNSSAFTAALRYFEGKWFARNILTGYRSDVSKQEAIDIFLEGWTGPA